MYYIAALIMGALFHNMEWLAFILEHIFELALGVAVVTVITVGFRRPAATRRTSSAPVQRSVVITPGAPVPPRRRRTAPGGWS
jgi:hypothetical protein